MYRIVQDISLKCVFSKVLSSFFFSQKIFRRLTKFMTELNFVNIFFLGGGGDKAVFLSLHHRKMRALEIIGTQDCHNMHVL